MFIIVNSMLLDHFLIKKKKGHMALDTTLKTKIYSYINSEIYLTFLPIRVLFTFDGLFGLSFVEGVFTTRCAFTALPHPSQRTRYDWLSYFMLASPPYQLGLESEKYWLAYSALNTTVFPGLSKLI